MNIPVVTFDVKSKMDLISIITNAKEREKCTYEELSEKTGIDKSNLIKIFNRRGNPTLYTLEKILQSLEITLVEHNAESN